MGNTLKWIGAGLVATGLLTNDQLLLIISIIVTVLGMIQSYLEAKRARAINPQDTLDEMRENS